MLNFKYSFLLGLSATFCAAADIDLSGGSKLSGEVLAMDGNGVLTISTLLSDKPLKLNVSHVEAVDFKNSGDSIDSIHQRLTLVNGDTLPVSIKSLTGDSLIAASPAMGSMEIATALIDSVQLGLFPQNSIYSGPTGFNDWQRDSRGSRNWSMKGNAFHVEGSGKLSRELTLPEKYTVSFRLGWQNIPNFHFFFADTLDGEERRDRYVLQFDASGMDIKREASASNRSTPIAVVGQKPETFVEKKMSVEIRVDQSTARLELYIDGKLVGRYMDPVPEPPSGSGISFEFQGESGQKQTIDQIEITEWDERSDRYRSEDRGDLTTDSIIDRFGDRFGGELISIKQDGEAKVYVFKSDFHKEPIELLEADVSTIFFAREPEPEGRSGSLILHLSDGGEIHAEECEFGEKSARILHPLLGSIELDRSSVARLERSENTEKGKVSEEP